MEFTKVELDQVQQTSAQATAAAVQELDALQLALIGGGMGDVVIL